MEQSCLCLCRSLPEAPARVIYLFPTLHIAKSAHLGELLILLMFLLARGRRSRHDEVVDVVIVNLRAIVDSGVGDVAPDVVVDVYNNQFV